MKRNIYKFLKIIGITFVSIIFLIFIIGEGISFFILTPSFIEKKVKDIFKKNYNRQVILKVKRFNIFTGLDINNLVIYNKKNYCKNPIFIKVDRIKIKYNLFYLLFFKLYIKDISIINPAINLEYSPDRKEWNFTDFIKENNKKKKRVLKFNIKLKRFLIKNFRLEVINNNYFLIKNINILSAFHIHKTELKGINNLFFKVFTTGKKNIIIKRDKRSILAIPLNLNSIILINNKKGICKFNYKILNQFLEFNNKIFRIPDIKFSLDSDININKDIFYIKTFKLIINKEPFINLKGSLKNITDNKNMYFNIKSINNFFHFSRIRYLLRFFFNDNRADIKGIFKISNLIMNNKKFINFLGDINIKKFYLKIPSKKIDVNNFNLNVLFKNNKYNIKDGRILIFAPFINFDKFKIFNFNTIIKLIIKKNNLKYARFLINSVKINNGIFNSILNYNNKNIAGKISLNNFTLVSVNSNLNGKTGFLTRINGNNNIIKIDFNLLGENIRFKNKDDFSQRFNINSKSIINYYINSKNVYVKNFSINGGDFLKFEMTLFSKNEFNIIKGLSKDFYLDLGKVYELLPYSTKKSFSFASIKGILQNKIYFKKEYNRIVLSYIATNNSMTLKNKDSSEFIIHKIYSQLDLNKNNNIILLNYKFSTGDLIRRYFIENTNTNIEVKYNRIISGINLYSDIVNRDNSINVKNLIFKIPDINMVGILRGKKDNNKINFNINFNVNAKKKLLFFNNIYLKGAMKFITDIKSYSNNTLIKGNIGFNNFNLSLNDILIKDMNGYIPFTHIIGSKKKLSKELLYDSAIKNLEILNYPLIRLYEKEPDNFIIRELRLSKNNLILKNMKFDINYERNMVRINKGDLDFLDGSITINKSYFDLSDMNKNNFTYQFNMEITGVNPVLIKKIKLNRKEDTRVYGNIRVKGKGIDILTSNDFYAAFNITHIGSELASKFLQVLDPTGKDKKINLVRNALEHGAQPELINFEIKYGLVYSKIWIKESNFYKYVLFMIPRLPPSPIEFEKKSLENIVKVFNKK